MHVHGLYTLSLKNTANEAEGLPWDPVRAPSMNAVDSTPGQFTIDLSYASPTPNRGINYTSIAPVAFLLRIELMSLQTFSFKWAVSF